MPSVHELVRRQAGRCAGRLAVRSPTEQLTYEELTRRAQALAAKLDAQGNRPDEPVGVCLPRGPHLVVAMLAVFESGGAVLPIDPATPPDRLDRVLDSANVSTCLIDQTRDYRAATSASMPELPMSASGRGPWLRRMLRAQRACPLGPGDIVLHSAGIESPNALMEIFWPLCAGATVVAADAADPQSRLLSCQQYRPTTMLLPVEQLGEMLDFLDAYHLLAPPWLRRVVCTKGPVPRSLRRRCTGRPGWRDCALHVLGDAA